MNIPEELIRRELRLKAIATAKAKIEQRAAERFAKEQKAYEEKLAARKAKEKETGKNPKVVRPFPHTLDPKAKIRSISPTATHGSCPRREGASSKPTTARRQWTLTPCLL